MDEHHADFMDSDDAFAELLRRNAKARANRRGHDLHFRLPVAFAESITGANKRLTLPDGGTLDVTIPPGLMDGQILRLRGKGAPGFGTGGHGDALIEVAVMPDPRFTRERDDISLELPISLAEAVLGGKIRVPTVVDVPSAASAWRFPHRDPQAGSDDAAQRGVRRRLLARAGTM